jgi:hypothetical protein
VNKICLRWPFTLLFVIVCLCLGSGGGDAATTSQIKFSVLNCPSDAGELPTLNMGALNAADFKVKPLIWTRRRGVLTATLAMSRAWMKAYLETSHCHTESLQLVVLPGHVRHLSIGLISKAVLIDAHPPLFIVAGELPLPNMRVELVIGSPWNSEADRRRAVIDDGAYYVGAPLGRFTLELTASPLWSLIPIDTSRTPRYSLIRHDVSQFELQMHSSNKNRPHRFFILHAPKR